ncbi:hypothetical protein ACFV03_50975 [Streptomyces mirabilis]|uniref:hypothetical protein n=1 Tax=Streptomyces mirabilis TaxID=68239 RepID=UPI0036B7B90B
MSDVELHDLLIRSQQLKSTPRGKETRRGQLFNAFPRDLPRARGPEAHSGQRETWPCSLSVTALLTGFSSSGQVKDIADVRGK